MGKRNAAEVFVIVEDRNLETFVRKTLVVFGINFRKAHISQDYPRGGRGSGKQYVAKKFEEVVVTVRRKSRENKVLLLGTEADEQTVAQRAHVLDSIIDPPRAPQEGIIYWIPKRHVETWGLHLNGNAVDEDTDYHNRGKGIDWKRAGETFKAEYDRSKREIVEALDSLKTAYIETQRLGQ
jgi:hypothetical protein